jgi:hypothetical protein
LGQGLPVVMFEDDDNIHIQEHTDFIVRNATDMMRNQVTLMYFLTHVEQHRIGLKTKQGEISPEAAKLTMMSQSQARQRPVDPAAIQADSQMRKLQPEAPGAPPTAGAPQPAPQAPAPKPQAPQAAPTQGGQNGTQP